MPLRKDAHLKGETQNKSTCILNPEGEHSGDDLGRSAPVLYSKEARPTSAAPSSWPLLNHPAAYATAVKFRKRQGWLKRMNDIISRTLQGRERAAAWDAIAQASQAEQEQRRLFKRAAKAAEQDPAEVTIYALRHSNIVRQLLAGVPIRVVAVNHDTSVTMIERTYSRHIGDHSDQLARGALLDTTAPAGGNIVPIRASGVTE